MSDELESLDRLTFLKQAFGEHATAFDSNLDEVAKINFDAYKHKLHHLRPTLLTRQTLSKKIPSFWLSALKNCRATARFVDPADEIALKHLDEVWIEHGKEDPREWEFKLTFSSKNPSFSNTILSRKFTCTPPSPAPAPSAFDLEADVYLLPTTAPSWTSPEHNLLLKAPRADPTQMEEFDDFGGPGSFFHLFDDKLDGEDQIGMAEILLEWWAHATEYAAGLTAIDDLSSDDEGFFGLDGDDDEDSDDDPTKEIDLGSEEEEEEEKRPKKKSKKN
ncbi:hypothetical protein BCR35DRAFT_302421 [Leucosporidium creatinivorum]|uniref:Nucleosome assembly protein n=1 Tax=Leucosporidium creatinivorum TaxID=106004 RepID=A0A1Y2FRR7_9BASI|nr:hypothetical protein BCR35DRAFT_302421 [Leucosporidium creatinivorum]